MSGTDAGPEAGGDLQRKMTEKIRSQAQKIVEIEASRNKLQAEKEYIHRSLDAKVHLLDRLTDTLSQQFMQVASHEQLLEVVQQLIAENKIMKHASAAGHDTSRSDAQASSREELVASIAELRKANAGLVQYKAKCDERAVTAAETNNKLHSEILSLQKTLRQSNFELAASQKKLEQLQSRLSLSTEAFEGLNLILRTTVECLVYFGSDMLV